MDRQVVTVVSACVAEVTETWVFSVPDASVVDGLSPEEALAVLRGSDAVDLMGVEHEVDGERDRTVLSVRVR